MTSASDQSSERSEAADREILRLTTELRNTRKTLADFNHSLAVARRRLHGVSFLKELESYKNYIESTAGNARYATLPTRDMTYKLRNHQYVASHGIRVPSVVGRWRNIDEVNYEQLPEAFVLKADGGSTSHGVLPLLKSSPDRFVAADGSRAYNAREIRQHFKSAYWNGSAYGTLFAEEFLIPKGNATGIPDDIKIYAMHGDIAQILVRSVDVHGTVSATRSKYLDEHGNDLGNIAGHRNLDDSIDVPSTLPEMVSIARHLSRAVGLPFCRVDLYDTNDGVVVGEITRAPGGAQTYAPEHDEMMGRKWHIANAELTLEYQKGRPAGALWGRYKVPQFYAKGHPMHGAYRDATITDCADWCQ